MANANVDPAIAIRLLEVKKNQLKMVYRRGYKIDREAFILQLDVAKFLEIYVPFAQQHSKTFRGAITAVYEHETNPDKRLVVYYAETPTTSQLGVGDVGEAVVYMTQTKASDAIVITAKPLSQPAIKHVTGLVSYNIQIFMEEEMSYDPTEHFLVPKHIPLTDEEQREFLNGNKIEIDALPIIATNDIIARYYGLRPGRVVRIERENMYETSIIKSLSYKVIKDVVEK